MNRSMSANMSVSRTITAVVIIVILLTILRRVLSRMRRQISRDVHRTILQICNHQLKNLSRVAILEQRSQIRLMLLTARKIQARARATR